MEIKENSIMQHLQNRASSCAGQGQQISIAILVVAQGPFS
jgi:hypothetical protein